MRPQHCFARSSETEKAQPMIKVPAQQCQNASHSILHRPTNLLAPSDPQMRRTIEPAGILVIARYTDFLRGTSSSYSTSARLGSDPRMRPMGGQFPRTVRLKYRAALQTETLPSSDWHQRDPIIGDFC